MNIRKSMRFEDVMSQPPDSQQVRHWRRADSLTVSRPTAARRSKTRPVEAMLLAISTPTRNKSALPHVHRTVPQAELIHQAIVGRLGKGHRVDCPELTGHDSLGRPLQNGHRHAHILPLDLDGDQHLDHILIWAPMGLGDAAQGAIRSLKRTWTKGGAGDLQVALVGRGGLGALRNLPEALRRRADRLLASAEASSLTGKETRIGTKCWASLTPMVLPRFLKRHGRNCLEGQIQAELESRDLPRAASIEVLQDRTIAMRHFVRVRRRSGNPPPCDMGYGVRIAFDEPQLGPIALGYASHFGLGLFEAVQDSDSTERLQRIPGK